MMQGQGAWWTWHRLWLYLGVTLLAVYLVCYVYALAGAAGATTDASCPSLWGFMATRLAVGLVTTLSMWCYSYAAGRYYGDGVVDGRNYYDDGGGAPPLQPMMSGVLPAAGWVAALLYFGGFTAAGGVIVSNSMVVHASACVGQLSASSLTGTPLLGDLGWVTFGLDLLTSLLLLIAGVVAVWAQSARRRRQ